MTEEALLLALIQHDEAGHGDPFIHCSWCGGAERRNPRDLFAALAQSEEVMTNTPERSPAEVLKDALAKDTESTYLWVEVHKVIPAIEAMQRERDEARAELDRLRAALDVSEVTHEYAAMNRVGRQVSGASLSLDSIESVMRDSMASPTDYIAVRDVRKVRSEWREGTPPTPQPDGEVQGD